MSVPSALALETHVFERSFGSAGEGAGGLSEPAAVAINNETHDVYVADPGNHRVDEFGEKGEFLRAWGWGVADGVSEEPQTCTLTCFKGLPGSAPGQLATPVFIAVDNSGGASKEDVYVADSADNTITKFTAEGALIESWGVKGQINATPTGEGGASVSFVALDGVAVDSAGTLDVIESGYPLEEAPQQLFEFKEDGTFDAHFANPRESEPFGLGVNTAGNFFKLTFAGEVEEFGPGGSAIGPVNVRPAGKDVGLAIDALNNDLYVDREGNVIEHLAFNGSGEVIEATGATCPVTIESSGCKATDDFGSGILQGGRGVAVDSSSHVFVADVLADRVDVFVPAVLPDVTTLAATELRPTTGTLNGKVKPDGIALSECKFEYVDAAHYEPAAGNPYAAGATVPCVPAAGGIATGGETAVSADVLGLRHDVVYHYRLVAGNEHGANTGVDELFTTPGAGIESESVSEVTDDSVSFQATIEPNNTPATYYFQYSTSDTGACTPPTCKQVPATPGSIPAGASPVKVSESAQGLQANTVYHYRVVAVSELSFGSEEFDGADHTFTTHATGSTNATGEFLLPDHRQWQMVSPPHKQGVLIEPIGGPALNEGVVQAAADGHAITYETDAPTESGTVGYDNLVQVLSARNADGWGSRDLTVPHTAFTGLSVGSGDEWRLFSQDLSQAAVQPFGQFVPCTNAKGVPQACISPVASEQTPVVEDTQSALFTPLVTGCPASGPCAKVVEEHANVPAGTVFGGGEACAALICGPGFADATPDFSHVVLGGGELTSTPTPESALYEWSANTPTAAQLRVLSLLPPNEAGEVLPAAAPALGRAGFPGVVRNAVSEDGSRVVWTGEGHIYMRENAARPQSPISEGKCSILVDACTVQVDAGPAGNPEFQIASRDVSRVFFTEAGDLFEFDVGDTEPVELTSGAELLGLVVGASEDGSYVYFVARGALAAGAVAGQPNMYVRHEGVTSLVAVLSDADTNDWGRQGEGQLEYLTGRVSPDGRWLAFMSQLSLTGYDNRDAVSGQPDEEVYLYHAPDDLSSGPGGLVCASCNPTGERPHGVEYGINGSESFPSIPLAGGDRVWVGSAWLAANVPGWTPTTKKAPLYQSRYLSDSGRLFFNSSDGLVPEDGNGVGDVYEYEPVGVGPVGAVCGPGVAGGSEVFEPEREVSGGVVAPAGCVGLISSGSGSQESAFLDASEDGSDVFFLTSSKLVNGDFDDALDVYDAHECSAGSPCLAEVVAGSPACDTEASCKAAPSAQPEGFGAPSSSTFSGPGNPVPPARPAPAKGKTAEQLRLQHLAAALKVCRKKHAKHKRQLCEKQARKRYAAKASVKRPGTAGRASSDRGAGR